MIELLKQRASIDIPLIDNMLATIVITNSNLIKGVYEQIIKGGKRLRPLIVLYSALSLNESTNIEKALKLGCIVELIHTASLLHDDVIDEATKRRNKDTAHTVYGINPTILSGDYLYSLAFNMVLEFDITIAKNISRAAYLLSEGETEEIEHAFNPNISVDKYLNIIYKKTAVLIESSAVVGSMLSTQNYQRIFGEFGKNLGMAFQIRDDCLDFEQTKTMGKDSEHDLKEGKLTLPTLYAIRKHISLRRDIVEYFKTGDGGLLNSIHDGVRESGLKEALNMAKKYSEKAKETIKLLDDSQYKNYLMAMCDYAVEREK